ncbi:MAG: thioredoxin family protein [Luteolibacter sp.]
MKSLIPLLTAGLIASLTASAAEIGKPAPDFTVNDLEGKSVSLAEFKDQVVVLEWTNFDCPFVKKHYESGNMPKLQEKFKKMGVVWLTINSSAEGKQGYHPATKMAEVAAQNGNKASHFLIDSDGKMGKAYGAKVTPHMFIIHKNGNLVYNGAIDSVASTKVEDVEKAEAWLANAIDAILAGKEINNASNKPYGCGVKY